jgi:hypothetical protein
MEYAKDKFIILFIVFLMFMIYIKIYMNSKKKLSIIFFLW